MLKNCALPATYNNYKNSRRCGEIICHDDADFTIVCIFCKIKIFEFDDFLLHYRNVHLNEPLQRPDAVATKGSTKYAMKAIKQEPFEDVEYLTELADEFSEDVDAMRILPGLGMKHENVDVDVDANVQKEPEVAAEVDPVAFANDNENSFDVGDFGADTLGMDDDSETNEAWQADDRALSPSAADDEAENRILKRRKPKEFVCEHCCKRYTTEKCLNMHVKMQHLRPKDFKCDQCEEAFSTSRGLQTHVRNVHTLFPCPQCERVYKSLHSLRVHASSHRVEKAFVCDFENCGKAFVDQRRLTVHKKVHSEERNYICEICGYRTRQKDALIIHKRSHTGEKPYECKICGRRFTSSSLLNEHKPMHSTERPHVCEVCGAAFSRAKALYHHKHLHLGVKKFVCKLCGRAYAQMAGLSGHMRQHRMEDGLLGHPAT